MIYSYGISMQGAYHIKHDIVCQDAHYFKKINEHFAIGAVADGLGSEMYSDIASKIASEKSVEYCAEIIQADTDEKSILDIIKKSFHIALDAIYEVAEQANHDKDQYDTTLSLAVYLKGNLYYGQAGDSGIVVLNKNGTYESVTQQQRDDNGCVFPLFFGEEKWTFGKKEDVASVLLATDGMYETLFPYLLQGEETSIYVALAQFMMSNDCLGFSQQKQVEVQKKMESFIEGIPDSQVEDDKTVLVMLDDSIEVEKMQDAYYQTPDWEKLKKKRDKEYKRAAYPHLSGED